MLQLIVPVTVQHNLLLEYTPLVDWLKAFAVNDNADDLSLYEIPVLLAAN
jgi:hypothetical protein